MNTNDVHSLVARQACRIVEADAGSRADVLSNRVAARVELQVTLAHICSQVNISIDDHFQEAPACPRKP